NQQSDIGFSEQDTSSVKNQLVKLLKIHNIENPEVKVDNLVTHINIAVVRMRNNSMIEQKFEIEEQPLSTILKHFFDDMVYFIEERFNLILPKKEIEYLYIHFVSTGIMNEVSNIPRNEEVDKMIQHMLDNVQRVFYLDLQSDEALKENIYLHLLTSINRYKYKMNIRNPMLEEIKQNYPFAFDIGVVASKMIEKDLKVQVSESEIGYLALHFEMALNRNNIDEKKLNIILVCNSGLTSSQLIKYKLIQNFRNQIQITEIIELYNIEKANINKADIIISPVPINHDINIPILYVSPILSQNNINMIQRYIDLKPLDNKEQLIKMLELNKDFNNKDDVLNYLNEYLTDQKLIEEIGRASCREE